MMNQLMRMMPVLMVIATLTLASGCKKVNDPANPEGMATQQTGDAGTQESAPMDGDTATMDEQGKPMKGATNNMEPNQVPLENHPTNATKLKGLEANTVPMDRQEADTLYNNKDATMKKDVPQSVHKQ